MGVPYDSGHFDLQPALSEFDAPLPAAQSNPNVSSKFGHWASTKVFIKGTAPIREREAPHNENRCYQGHILWTNSGLACNIPCSNDPLYNGEFVAKRHGDDDV
jgi:hypothetical protein